MILNHTHADKEFFSKYSHEPPSWFEFLLDTTGEKLVTHLTKGAEPSAAYLISLFVDKASTPITNTGGPPAQRAYSAQLWDLALFTASHVRWCPRVLEQVPTSILQRLLSHLVKTTVPVETRALDTNELELEEIPKQGLAALFLYHRWVIAAYVQLQLPRKPGKKSIEMPGYLPTLPALQLIEQELPHSKDFLDKIGQEKPQLMIPHAGTCSQNGTDHLNNHGNLLHANTSAAQSYFDLGVLAFFHQEYSEAYQHFKNAEALYDLSDHYFLSFNKDKVDHYLHGLQYLTHLADIRDHSLLSQLELTKANDYTGCVDLLLKDNTEQVLSYTYRRTFVKEVYEVCKDSTLCKHAFICNVLLQVAMGKCVDGRFWALLKEDKGLVVDFLIKATQTMMKDCKADVKLLLKYFFLGLVSKNILKDKRSDILAAVGGGLGIWFIGNMMPVLTKPSTMLTYAKSKESEIVNYYNDLAAETKFINIKDIISKICQLQPNFHMQPFCDRIFKDVRTTQAFLPLTDSLACPRPLAFVLCNRLAQLCHYECYKEAMLLIADIKEYLKNAQYAAFKRGNSTKLLDRLETIIEALHINDTLCNSKKKVRLSEDFTSSVSRLSGSNNQACPLKSNIIPAVLLNLKAQPTLQNSGDGFEFIAGEIWLFLQNQDHNLGRLFKLLVPMHSTNPPSSIVNRVDLVSFCCNFVEEQSLELLVGILVHLFNSTVDDQWHNITYNVITRTWPELGKEAHVTACASTLGAVLRHARRHHPTNLKLMSVQSDYSMYAADNDNTIRSLLSSGAIQLDCFSSLKTLDRWLDSSFYNLVKCCMNLNAHIEVALLCCMKSPPDYTTSFQALKRTSAQDQLHIYYPLIWDVNLLECAVSQHHKRGEIVLRDYVIGLIGRPEINENNPQSLIRRTVLAKKSAFLKTLFIKFLGK